MDSERLNIILGRAHGKSHGGFILFKFKLLICLIKLFDTIVHFNVKYKVGFKLEIFRF